MSNTKELAVGRWKSILENFTDGKHAYFSGKHCPCPLCGGVDRFRFDDKKGSGSYFCTCGAGSGIHLLSQLKGLSYAEAWKLVDTVIDTSVLSEGTPAADRIARVQGILKLCHPITSGGSVDRYLASRGLDIPFGLMEAMSPSGTSMMVGKFALGAKLKGLHVTYILDGKKDTRNGSAKKMYGIEDKCLPGSAIRLDHLYEGNKIVVAEGIETALSAGKIFNAPAWATGSAYLMETLQIPPQITDVVIAADNDASFTGQAAGYNLAKKLHQNGLHVTIKLPKNGSDWNDDQN